MLTPKSRAILTNSGMGGTRLPCSYIPTALGLIFSAEASRRCDSPALLRRTAIRIPSIFHSCLSVRIMPFIRRISE